MSTHTPGPWFADEYKVWGHKEVEYEGGVGGPRFSYKIADATLHNPWKFEEQYANARLIAAAPELYEALKSLRDATLSEHPSLIADAFMSADIALRKVEGAV